MPAYANKLNGVPVPVFRERAVLMSRCPIFALCGYLNPSVAPFSVRLIMIVIDLKLLRSVL
jgi:hypothetical protein